MRMLQKRSRDPQRAVPRVVCVLCGGELYEGCPRWRLGGGDYCEGCLIRRVLEELAPFRVQREEAWP